MVTCAKRHPVSAYFVFTFALSWLGFLVVVGPGALVNPDWRAERTFLPAVFAMLAGPSTAGLLLTGLLDGRAGYRALMARLLAWRVGWRWYAVALLPAPLVSAIGLMALSLDAPLFSEQWAVVLLAGAGAGISTVLEEIGWTGFAVPRLRRHRSVFATGLIVGVLWGLWHTLQQIFIGGTYAGGIPLPVFVGLALLAAVASLTAYRVLMVWLYDRTGSLLVTTLMHGMLTASSIFWFTPAVTGGLFLVDVWLGAAAMWLIVAVVAALDGWITLAHTTPFRGADGAVLADSVAEAGYLRLGGVRQWVLVRGAHVANPVLIVLHGGPGMSEMGFFRHCNADLEHHFTVVHWDQRGAGKSFHPDLPAESMRVDRFVADLDELVDLMRRRFAQPRIALLGHSWGSALGAIYAARYPEKVAVYVGAAQIGDWAAAESLSYEYALQEAARQHDERALETLREMGAPPYRARDVFAERTIVSRLDGQMHPRVLWRAGRALLARPESSLLDLPRVLRGFAFTLEAMWAEVSRLDLLTAVPALRMPVVVLVGRRDHWVPPETSVAFYEALRAPWKALVWFETSGHEAFVDEPDKFNTTLIEIVRPLALSVPRIAA